MDSATAAAIFQVGKGRMSLCSYVLSSLWLICAEWDITLGVTHIPGEDLTASVNALSCWHMGQHYKGHVHSSVHDREIRLVIIAPDAFCLPEFLYVRFLLRGYNMTLARLK